MALDSEVFQCTYYLMIRSFLLYVYVLYNSFSLKANLSPSQRFNFWCSFLSAPWNGCSIDARYYLRLWIRYIFHKRIQKQLVWTTPNLHNPFSDRVTWGSVRDQLSHRVSQMFHLFPGAAKEVIQGHTRWSEIARVGWCVLQHTMKLSRKVMLPCKSSHSPKRENVFHFVSLFILEFLNPERTNTYSSRGGLQDFSQMPGLGHCYHCCNMLQSL